MWYIWKAKNDKLFRVIDRDPLKTIRHAESECHAWFEANIRQEQEVIQNKEQRIRNNQPNH